MFTCPYCNGRFDAAPFIVHVKTCKPRGESADERDARYLAAREADADFDEKHPPETAYEKRLFKEDERRFGLDAAVKNDKARTEWRGKKG